MDKIDLTFQYTQEEFIKAERQYLFGNKTFSKTSIVLTPVCFVFSIFFLFFSSFSAFSIILVTLVTLCMLLEYILYFILPKSRFKKTKKYQEKYHLSFSDTGILFETASIHSELEWNIYSALWENDDFYFLIQAPKMYGLIPKRAFPDSATKDAFEKLVLEKLNCTKRVL